MIDVVWFKRDLRIHDHAPLANAAASGRPVLALYIAEPGYWALPDTSARQWAFIAEGLVELDAALNRIGNRLICHVGDAVEVIQAIHETHAIATLHAHEETGNAWTFARDRAVHRFCRQAGITFAESPQFGVTRRLADRNRWSRLWEAQMAAPQVKAPAALRAVDGLAPAPIPTEAVLGLSDDPCPGRQPGGRAAGRALLASFLDGRGRGYPRLMSSPLSAAEACSRLSPHLALGTLSMREVVQAVNARRASEAARDAHERPLALRDIDALIARLHWHCHFIQKLESEPAMEWQAMHPLHEAHRPRHAQDDPRVIAWIEGRTGFPFIDACMRMLKDTGWINFRMRAMLMAFASYHLDLDWTATGAALARRFVDYEPGIHWPQVQMQSGQTGINTPRIYNPVKQSHDQDPDGVFIRRHVPELARVAPAFIHEPWRMDADEQAQAGVTIGVDYPAPVVDHVAAARDARERLSAIRRMGGYRAASNAVYERHGSRKRTLKDDDPEKSRAIAARKAAKLARQFTLDL